MSQIQAKSLDTDTILKRRHLVWYLAQHVTVRATDIEKSGFRMNPYFGHPDKNVKILNGSAFKWLVGTIVAQAYHNG